jgi:thioesterase domain-containing protein
MLSLLRDVWAQSMPVTQALGISAVSRNATELVLSLPLGPNRNHKGTMFAGSMCAVATLGGWSALWLLSREADVTPHVVIQDSNMEYLLPARSDVLATVNLPEPPSWERALKTLANRGRARLGVRVQISDSAGIVVANFDGRYVIHRTDMFE